MIAKAVFYGMDGWIGMHASAVGVAFLGEFGQVGEYTSRWHESPYSVRSVLYVIYAKGATLMNMFILRLSWYAFDVYFAKI